MFGNFVYFYYLVVSPKPEVLFFFILFLHSLWPKTLSNEMYFVFKENIGINKNFAF